MRQTAVVGIQKRLTRCFRELEVTTQQHEKPPKFPKKKLLHFTRGSLARWLHHQRFAVLQADVLDLFLGTHPKHCGGETHVPVRASTRCWAPKRAKKGLGMLWLLVYLHLFL